MTRLSISAGQDVIALIAHQLGYMPEESIVLLTMHGATFGATLRVDVPGTGHDAKDYAVRLCTYLLTDQDADGSLFAVFTGKEGTDGTHPYAEHVEVLMQEMNTAGLPVKSGWLITPAGWTDCRCVQDCCAALKPLGQVTDSLINAELIFRGSSYAQDAEPVFPACTGTAATEATITAAAKELHVEDPHDGTGAAGGGQHTGCPPRSAGGGGLPLFAPPAAVDAGAAPPNPGNPPVAQLEWKETAPSVQGGPMNAPDFSHNALNIQYTDGGSGAEDLLTDTAAQAAGTGRVTDLVWSDGSHNLPA